MKKLLGILFLGLVLVGCKAKKQESSINSSGDDGYVNLYNGENMDNWTLICRDKTQGLPQKVFAAGEDGEMHIFKDFPDGDRVKEGRGGTHCMFFTKEKYSRYSFKFEYKWGEKIFNNFDQFQYDAGLYFHVFDVAIWPKGYEYQVRYDHTKNENHTGCIWNSGGQFDWYADNTSVEPKERHYLPKEEGGIAQEHRGGEHKVYQKAPFHGLDGEWNQCEVIVMGNKYAIYKLNGKVVNVITNLAHSKGEIGMQAETAEVFYRNIQMKEFDADIPMERFLK